MQEVDITSSIEGRRTINTVKCIISCYSTKRILCKMVVTPMKSCILVFFEIRMGKSAALQYFKMHLFKLNKNLLNLSGTLLLPKFKLKL